MEQTTTPTKPRRVFVHGASKFMEGVDFDASLSDQEVQEALAVHYPLLENATLSPPVESGEGENKVVTRKFEVKFGQKGTDTAGQATSHGLTPFVKALMEAPPHILSIWYVLPELNAATLDQQVLMGHALAVADDEARAEGDAVTELVQKLVG